MKPGANRDYLHRSSWRCDYRGVRDYVRLELNDGSKTYPTPPDNQGRTFRLSNRSHGGLLCEYGGLVSMGMDVAFG